MTTLKLNDYSQNRFNLRLSKNLAKLLLTVGIVVCVETYVNGSSWYRVYSDGWCEQGGFATISTDNETVVLLKSYKDINYHILFTQNTTEGLINPKSDAYTGQVRAMTTACNKTTNNFKIYNTGVRQGDVAWISYGYLA